MAKTGNTYLQRLFLDTRAKVCVISLPDISAATMRELLAFIYTGEVSVEEEEPMDRLMGAAEALEIRGLTTDTHNGESTKKRKETVEDQQRERYQDNNEADFVQAIAKCRHVSMHARLYQ